MTGETVSTALTTQSGAEGILSLVSRAAEDPQIDVAKMQALLDVQERIINKQAEMAYYAAMSRLQPRLPRVEKRGAIKVRGEIQSRYARFEDVDEVVRPLLLEEGFNFTYGSSTNNDRVMVTGTISHVGGHRVTSSINLPADTSGNKNNVQAIGSSITYARRYLLCLMLNIVIMGEDSDGNNAALVTEQQVMQLEYMIQSSGANREKFLSTLGLEKLGSMSQTVFPVAMNLLRQKRK